MHDLGDALLVPVAAVVHYDYGRIRKCERENIPHRLGGVMAV